MTRPRLTDAVVDLARERRMFAVRLGEVFSGLRPKRDLLAPAVLAQVGLKFMTRLFAALHEDP